MKILVVEDDPTIIDVYGFYIELALGSDKFDLCTNGTDAAAKINENSYDIIFLDNSLPDMSGLEVAQQTNSSTKIIVVSGDVSVKMEQDYKKEGVDHLIEKPIDIDELKSKIKLILGSH